MMNDPQSVQGSTTCPTPLPAHVMPARVSAAFNVIAHCQHILNGMIGPEGDVIVDGRSLTSSEACMKVAAMRRITQFLTGEDLSEAL